MKKLVLMAVALLMLGFASCEKRDYDPKDPNPYCFKITATISSEGETAKSSMYAWGTGSEVDQVAKIYEDQIKKQFTDEGVSIRLDIEKSGISTEVECAKQNIK